MQHLEIITILIATIPWLIFLTGYFVRIHMKIREVEKAHHECHTLRIREESETNSKLDAVQIDMAEIKNDVKWLVKTAKNGGPE